MFLGFFVCDLFGFKPTESGDNRLVTKEELNTTLPDANIKGDGIGKKYDNMLKNYGRIKDETAVELAKRLEQAGVDAVTVHGRFAEQLYRGASDRGVIGRVKEAVSVPVVGNGDIKCGADAVAMVRETGCDAVMIARAAEGNPWIFEQVKAALKGEEEPPKPTPFDRIQMARRHARLLEQREGRNIVRMRKHAMWYVTGLPGASKARGMFNYCTTLDDFERVFDQLEEICHAS